MRERDVFANVQMYYGEYVNLATVWPIYKVLHWATPEADENQ